MKSRISCRLLLVTLSLALPAGFLALADGDDGSSFVLGITEGPDPIPHLSWCQAYGEQEDIGEPGAGPWPDFEIDPTSGHVLAVWSHDAGGDHDIAFGEWDGARWRTTFLTSSTLDELDPAIHAAADGTLWVAWWDAGANDIMISWRPAGSDDWLRPRPVAPDGRRPSILVVGEQLLLAFERDAESGGQQIVLGRAQAPGGAFRFAVVAEIERSKPLDVELHATDGRIWLDWRESDSAFGYREAIGATWGPPMLVPWTDVSWTGVQMAREAIRRLVL